MSAYVVEDLCINRIVTFLDFDRESGAWTKLKLTELLGAFDPAKLGAAMRQLNCRSVEGRYEGARHMLPDEPYTHELAVVDAYQALKSLRCFLYQSCEAGCDELPLYKILDGYSHSLALRIINTRPEYERAAWG